MQQTLANLNVNMGHFFFPFALPCKCMQRDKMCKVAEVAFAF